jgi:serine/threonine-protein kinase
MFSQSNCQIKVFPRDQHSIATRRLANTIDLIIDDGRIYVIQEFVYGFSLKELIAKREYFDYRFNYFFYRIISKVLDTLSYIHAQQLCHCDIKPSNIMVCGSDEFGINMENPEIKIIDTGLLKPCFQPAIPDTGGKSFSIMYASPEQVLGFSELVGEHSDIFSTGLILYEAIAKEPALNTTNPMFIKKIQTGVKIESILCLMHNCTT